MLKVFMQPQYDVPDRAEGGIRRVVEAMQQYLPQYGVEIVNDIRVADVTAGHGVMQPIRPDVPFVSHSHGLHWSDYTWPNWAHEVNRAVVEAMIRAQAVTVPSKWVQAAFARGMLKPTEVVYHGVDADEWAHDLDAQNYVFWNKARADSVSDPRDMQTLAAKLPHVSFVTTIGEPTPNVDVLGVLPLPQMKPHLQRAGVYLATARETFGIGTLEALAAGVPVAGWDYGGQSEIIIHGETGYLAPFGDYDALAECVLSALRERARLSNNARDDARTRWGWQARIAQYAQIYQRVTGMHAQTPKVSIIVTCHNLAQYLPDALNSVYQQSLRDWECLIVDDASTDNTRALAMAYEHEHNQFVYLPTPHNLKLSGARNFGFARARGKYIIHLDADDMLAEDALATLCEALDRDPGIHIAYGSLDVMNQDGSDRRRNEFPQHFHWYGQMAHINQLHYAAMLRREVLQNAGGYRERMWRAEDAEFWCRVTSFGYRAAKVTESPTIVYRMRGDSKSAYEYQNFPDKDGDWCSWFPWRIADTGPKGAQFLRQYGDVVPNAHLVPFATQGEPPAGKLMWHVWHHQQPRVSVIIPVGPGHKPHVINALDSLIAQDVSDWEAVVVNDTGDDWDTVPGAPFAKVVLTRGAQGPAVARNAGLDATRGDLVLFLDADDWLTPGALRRMLEEYARGDASYIYSDYLQVGADWREEYKEVVEYNQHEWRGQHAITVLMATADAREIRFDETLAGWEDWDFFIRCAIAGKCGRRVPEALFAYRFTTGTRRDGDLTERVGILLPELRKRHAAYFTGEMQMASCCGGNGDALIAIKRMLEVGEQPTMGTLNAGAEEHTDAPGVVRLEFIGDRVGAVTYTVNGNAYRGGNNAFDKFADAQPGDVEKLVGLGVWRVVPKPPPEPVRVEMPAVTARYTPPAAPQVETVQIVTAQIPDSPADQLVREMKTADAPKKRNKRSKTK